MADETTTYTGMISTNAEDVEFSPDSIDFLKQGELFKQLIRLVGKEKANRIIEKGTDVILAED